MFSFRIFLHHTLAFFLNSDGYLALLFGIRSFVPSPKNAYMAVLCICAKVVLLLHISIKLLATRFCTSSSNSIMQMMYFKFCMEADKNEQLIMCYCCCLQIGNASSHVCFAAVSISQGSFELQKCYNWSREKNFSDPLPRFLLLTDYCLLAFSWVKVLNESFLSLLRTEKDHHQASCQGHHQF